MRPTRDPLARAVVELRPDPWRCLLAVMTGVGALGSAIALLGVSGWLVTRASEQPPLLVLMVAVVAVRALGLGRGVLRYAERLVGHDIALRGAVRLRSRLFEALTDAPPSVGAGFRRGDLLARLGADVDDVAELVVRALLPIAVSAVTGLAAAATVGVILPPAGAVLAVGLVVAGVVAPLLVGRAAAAQEEAAHLEAALSAEVLDVLEHTDELTVAGAIPRRTAGTAALERRLAASRDRAARPAAAGAAVAVLGTGGALLGCLVIGAAALAGGRLDAPLLAVAVLVALGAAETVSALPAAAVSLVRARGAARRVCDLLGAGTPSAPRPVHPVADRRPHDLRVEGLACGAGTAVVLRGVDLDLPHGRRVAIVGASGTGKSTLLRTIAGLVPPREGRVRLAGRRHGSADVADLPDEVRRHVLTFVADDAHVFGTTVRENLRLAAPDADDDRLTATLDLVGLGGWLRVQGQGLDTIVGTSTGEGAKLSGGERRRLLLARALLSDSDVLLLDEPSEHLDPAAADALVTSMLTRGSGSLSGDRTVVVVTHRLTPLGAADEILVLDGERVVARCRHGDLLRDHAPYRWAIEQETAGATAD